MAIAREALHNISSIGGPGAGEPVENLFVRNLWMVENVSYKLPTLGFESETLAGQTIDTGTNAFTFKEPIQVDGILTPAGHINLNNGAYFISGDGLVNKGLTVNIAGDILAKQKLTVTGETIHNGVLRQNAAIDMASNEMNGTGGVGGLGFAGTVNAFFKTGNVTVNDGDFHVQTGWIRANSYVRTDSNFNVSGVSGWTGTFDKDVDNTLTVAGGMVTGKT